MNQAATMDEVTALDSEVKALEVQLERARQKKAALELEREKHELERQQNLNVEDLKRQIHELNEQIHQPYVQQNGENIVRAIKESTIKQHLHQQNLENEPVKGPSEQAKQKHSWEKPDWALPSEAIPDESILKDSIQNPLLKAAATSGYERKVHEADIALIPGKFVQPSKAKVVEPRMVWIVVNIDGSKVGKIVMHLYGNFLPLTDVFTELKGLELLRCSSTTLVVNDIEPHFYVHAGSISSFPQSFPKQATTECYGVVLEGMDILQKLLSAPQDAVLTIKQSHIFPVKKTK